MESDPSLGFFLTRQRTHVQVIRKADGGVSLVDLRTLAALDLDAEGLGELRGLLDRAAMPGQVPPRVGHGPGCRCTPCKAEPSYRAHGRAFRPCCDHCNNREGDPAGHGYVPGGSVHDGPCEQCAAERARREHDKGTG